MQVNECIYMYIYITVYSYFCYLVVTNVQISPSVFVSDLAGTYTGECLEPIMNACTITQIQHSVQDNAQRFI